MDSVEKALRIKLARELKAEARRLEETSGVGFSYAYGFYDAADFIEVEGQPLRTLPNGLCGNKNDHRPHKHTSDTLGDLWCSADQKSRLPFAAEARRTTT